MLEAYELGKATVGQSYEDLIYGGKLPGWMDFDSPELEMFFEAGRRGADLPRWSYGWRVGPMPKDRRSWNAKEQAFERGVSVMEASHGEGDVRRTSDQISAAFIAAKKGRQVVAIEGWESPYAVGGDGEPLLVGARELPKPKFATAEPAPAARVGLPEVKRAFPGAKVTGREGTFVVRLPNGRELAVETDATIHVDPQAFFKGRGRQPREGEVVGIFEDVPGRAIPLDGIIRLAKGAGEQTLRHEHLHAAMSLALTGKERSALLERYKNEEGVAEAYAKWKPQTPHTLFQKIRRFFQRLYRAFRPTVESRAERAFERVETGEVWRRPAARARGPGRAFAARPVEEIRRDIRELGPVTPESRAKFDRLKSEMARARESAPDLQSDVQRAYEAEAKTVGLVNTPIPGIWKRYKDAGGDASPEQFHCRARRARDAWGRGGDEGRRLRARRRGAVAVLPLAAGKEVRCRAQISAQRNPHDGLRNPGWHQEARAAQCPQGGTSRYSRERNRRRTPEDAGGGRSGPLSL
jgi:hypothetical protein